MDLEYRHVKCGEKVGAGFIKRRGEPGDTGRGRAGRQFPPLGWIVKFQCGPMGAVSWAVAVLVLVGRS